MAALVYCFLAVVLAGTRAFQPDEGDLRADVRQLQQMMATFAEEMRTLKMEKVVQAPTAEPGPGGNGGGSVYVRWGKTTCPTEAALVYDGIAGGSYYGHSGGGANYVCLPNDPEWGVFTDGNQGTAYMQGAEYELSYGNSPFEASLHDHDVSCAVCHVVSRGSKLMIPARVSCPSGWTQEYTGYLMAERYSHHRSEFVCVDVEPEGRPGGYLDHNGALFYPVEANCGSLPCPKYVQGRELTCVVCTK